MSFRCEACKVAQESGVRPTMKVVAYRDRVYNTHGGDIPGREIAIEQKLCPPCAGETPLARAMAKSLGAEPI